MKWHVYVVTNPSAARRYWRVRAENSKRRITALVSAYELIDAETFGEAITTAVRMVPGATATNLIMERAAT